MTLPINVKASRIPIESLSELRDLYKKDWPKNILPFYLIQNYLDWHLQDPKFVEENIEFVCLNGDWSDGTFYVLDKHQIFFYTLNDDCERLHTLLSILPEPREYLGCCIYAKHVNTIKKLIEERSPNWMEKFDVHNLLYHLPKEKGIAFELKSEDGIILKSLTSEAHITKIDSVYPFQRKGTSDYLFRKMMKYNPSLGAFDSQDLLMAWCFIYQSGVLTALQVDEQYKRQGLGSLIVRGMSKTLAEKGWDTIACVVDGNTASHNLFMKLGFHVIDEVHWVAFGSKDVSGTI